MHIDTDSERPHEVSAISRLLGKRIVTIGGGTGPFAVLSNLKRYPCSISAVVTMSDSGGSSRRLMDELGMLPVGDLRQALV
ncbi:MAG TPA: 2-phospho-L-lactate transferase CofD family protein, partial [Ktedonobacterales bacterium]